MHRTSQLIFGQLYNALSLFRHKGASVPNFFVPTGASIPRCFVTTGASIPHCFVATGASIPRCFVTTGASIPRCFVTTGANVPRRCLQLDDSSSNEVVCRKTDRKKATRSPNPAFCEEMRLPVPGPIKDLSRCRLDVSVWDKGVIGRDHMIGGFSRLCLWSRCGVVSFVVVVTEVAKHQQTNANQCCCLATNFQRLAISDPKLSPLALTTNDLSWFVAGNKSVVAAHV